MPIFDAYLALLTLATLGAYHLAPRGRARVAILCVASAACLAYLDAGALVVALAVGTVAYLAALGVRKLPEGATRRIAAVLSLGVLLAALVYYKYARLFLGALGIPIQRTSLWVPLGLSFLTFRLIAYFVDQQHPRAERPSLLSYGAFVLFFPTFVAGPLERWVTFHRGPSLSLTADQAGWALQRILYGVAKKVIIADRLAYNILRLGGGPLPPTTHQAWILFFAYGVQIYFDFSAYSDIAIGLGRLFGYEIMENFNRPFLARNMADFWRRWHMSLSEWIRLYLFMPIAGRRPSAGRLHSATLVAMSLCGLWHGAGWNFLLWGLYNGVGISAYHLWGSARRKYPAAESIARSRIVGVASLTATFLFVSLGFVFFSRSVPDTVLILRHMFGVS